VSDFANLLDGGRRLGPALWEALAAGEDPASDVVLLPVMPNGVPVAIGVAQGGAAAGASWSMQSLPVSRSADGAVVLPQPGLEGRMVVVIDDGVETGTVARAAALALRESGVGRLVLAVPVCPREATVDLQHRYDLVVAVSRPIARRDLSSHYDDFDTIDDDTARRLLWDHNAGG
jgi:predicted phosphoribosyltransferase